MRIQGPVLAILVAVVDSAARWVVALGGDFAFHADPLGLKPVLSCQPLFWPFPQERALFALAGAVCCALLLAFKADLPSRQFQMGRWLLLKANERRVNRARRNHPPNPSCGSETSKETSKGKP